MIVINSLVVVSGYIAGKHRMLKPLGDWIKKVAKRSNKDAPGEGSCEFPLTLATNFSEGLVCLDENFNVTPRCVPTIYTVIDAPGGNQWLQQIGIEELNTIINENKQEDV